MQSLSGKKYLIDTSHCPQHRSARIHYWKCLASYVCVIYLNGKIRGAIGSVYRKMLIFLSILFSFLWWRIYRSGKSTKMNYQKVCISKIISTLVEGIRTNEMATKFLTLDKTNTQNAGRWKELLSITRPVNFTPTCSPPFLSWRLWIYKIIDYW